jgi:protocatechuate 4,5-dioxygenase beta chain
MLVDHAFTLPLELFWPGPAPLPGAYRAGLRQHRAVPAADGGALLQVRPGHRPRHRILGLGCPRRGDRQGQRAGFINKEFDLMFMDKLVTDPLWVTRYSIPTWSNSPAPRASSCSTG